jgi:hypothetical protein
VSFLGSGVRAESGGSWVRERGATLTLERGGLSYATRKVSTRGKLEEIGRSLLTPRFFIPPNRDFECRPCHLVRTMDQLQLYERDHLDSLRAGSARPKAIWKQGLVYNGKLTYKGNEPVQPEELRRLIIEPSGVSAQELAEWKVEHRKRVTLLWLETQNHFYGLNEFRCAENRDDYLERSREILSTPDRVGLFELF